MSEETALIRVQKNELTLAEREFDEQITRAKQGERTGKKLFLGGSVVMAAGLAGLVLVPHIAFGVWAVGMLGTIVGVIKKEENGHRISQGERERLDRADWQRRRMEQDRGLRLNAAATAVLETEMRAGTLALGQELRVDFEAEAPKILCIEEMGNAFSPDAQDRRFRLRVAANLYEAEAEADGSLKRRSRLFTIIRNFEPTDEAPPPSSFAQPEKRLPSCAPI